MLGSLGMPEIIFILVLALLIFGPKRLPQVGRTLGRGLGEFRRATNDLKRTVETEIAAVDTEAPRPKPAPVPATSPSPEPESATADGAPEPAESADTAEPAEQPAEEEASAADDAASTPSTD